MIKRYFSSAPIIFPVLGLGLIVYFLYTLFTVLTFGSTLWEYNLQILPLFIYTALWIGICFLKRPATIGFVVFTVLMTLLFFILPESRLKKYVISVFIHPMPVNIALSVIILIFYQKIDRFSRQIKLKEAASEV